MVEAHPFRSAIVRTDQVASAGLAGSVAATDNDRTMLAALLNVPRVEKFEASYLMTPSARGRFTATGRLCAVLLLECGVTLEPVEQRIEREFSVEFWPPEQLENATDLDPDLDDPDIEEPAPIEDRKLDVGRYLVELTATLIEPFPRSPTAELERSQSAPTSAEHTASPFAKLAALKREGDT
ncbi:MAG: DUF177 domain-containing protein [Hyphomicrobiaceae bacterium]